MNLATQTEIYNLALQKLGVKTISSPSEDSTAARACNACYNLLRKSELRAHPWNFNVKRVELAASSTEPLFGRAATYPLPSDFLNIRAEDPMNNTGFVDYQVEGREIVSDFGGPLQIRYGADVTDTSLMDSTFVELLACRMAVQMAVVLTDSNMKKSDLKDDYKNALMLARRSNALENRPTDSAPDWWETVRT